MGPPHDTKECSPWESDALRWQRPSPPAPQPPAPGELTAIVEEYRALGLEVAIAELDVHTLDDESQAQIYGSVFAEALAAGITDISVWGFTDAHLYTWLPGAKPTLFDEDYNPKPAYFAVRDALQSFAAGTARPA